MEKVSRVSRKQNKKEERRQKIVKFFQTATLILSFVNEIIALIKNLKIKMIRQDGIPHLSKKYIIDT